MIAKEEFAAEEAGQSALQIVLQSALWQELSKSRRMLDEAQQLARLGSWNWDLTTNDLFWSDEVYRIFGLPLGFTPTYEKFLERVHPDDKALTEAVLEKTLRARQPYDHRLRIIRPDGAVRVLHTRGTSVVSETARPIRLMGVVQDITEQAQGEEERARLFQQVVTGRTQLQALSHRLVEVQESERRAIARELHDEIGQTLTGLKLMLEASTRLPAGERESRLEAALALVNDLMVQVRERSLDLRPAMLDDLGLLPALLWHFKRYETQTGIGVRFRHADLEQRFSPLIETAAYRIVQEALTNVARHASADEVRVWARADQSLLDLRIEDNGIGFDPSRVSPTASSGLAGIHERAVLLEGRLTIHSAPQMGTRVCVELPLSD